MAIWLAPPPIQLPASVESPRQTASAPTPPTVSGEMVPTIKTAIGPPMITPTVPAKNIINAFGPKLKRPLRLILKVINTSAAGSKYWLAIKYKLDFPTVASPVFDTEIHSGEIIPAVVKSAGIKYAINNAGTIP